MKAFCLREAVETYFLWSSKKLTEEQKPHEGTRKMSLTEGYAEKNYIWCSRKPKAYVQ